MRVQRRRFPRCNTRISGCTKIKVETPHQPVAKPRRFALKKVCILACGKSAGNWTKNRVAKPAPFRIANSAVSVAGRRGRRRGSTLYFTITSPTTNINHLARWAALGLALALAAPCSRRPASARSRRRPRVEASFELSVAHSPTRFLAPTICLSGQHPSTT